jgi:transcriptional regulator with XRE-family HTH domain
MNHDHATLELRDFLRSRRARVTPEQVGLRVPEGVRRGPGLRRAEVAQLAGLTESLYDRLEGGRARAVPEAVLEALARALRLGDEDRGRLFAVARPAVSRRRPMRAQQLRPGLRRVLDTLTDVPALVLGHRLDLLATNRLARAFFPDLSRADGNLTRYLFTVPAARELYRDWPSAARDAVAALHRHAAQHPHDPAVVDLVGELSVLDPDFRTWWATLDGSPARPGPHRFRHRLVGDLVLHEETLSPVTEADQTLAMLTADPGSPSESALRLLANLTLPG